MHRFSMRHSCDVDAHAGGLSHWQQDYDQLSSGRFQGTVRELWPQALPVQLFHEHAQQATFQRCLPWRNAVWMGWPDLRSPQPWHFDGRLIAHRPTPTLMWARAQQDFVLRMPAEFGLYGIVVDEAWFVHSLQSLQAKALQLPSLRALQSHSMALSPQTHAALCHTAEALLQLAAAQCTSTPPAPISATPEPLAPHSAFHAPDAPSSLLAQLLLQLCHVLNGAQPAAGLQRHTRRLATVLSAHHIARQNGLDSVHRLCAQLHVTPRTLGNHFHHSLAASPQEFLRMVRLNACRRALSSAAADSTVRDIAARWGFDHPGRFSSQYHTLFGELPSQHLARARATLPHTA